MDSIRVAKVEEVLCSKGGTTQRGTIHLTAHHLIFAYDEAGREEMWVPYPLISLVTRMPHTLQGKSPVTFRTRTFDIFTLSFKQDREAIDVFDSVKDLTVATSVAQLYAFHYTPNPPFEVNNGWTMYNPREEFGRMGVGSRTKAWRFTDINKDYTFCSTYPARLVVPTRISDTTLQYASKYRSKCRIPVLTYLHWANYGTLTRSSQPMVGLTQNRSVQDEKLIEAIFHSHHSPESRASNIPVYGATATNIIIDARPTTNAVANTAKGAGTENMDHYKEARKAYLGIDNIHTMRDSLGRVVEALRETELATTNVTGALPGETQSVPILDRQALRRSGWLRHISAIMEGTLLIIRNVHVNSSHVLIHCSDGWDRTAQLSALSQICLDPYYRTIRGFQVLVEKDWVSFGHKFLDRCGHLSSEKFFLAPAGDSGNASGAEAFFASVQSKFASQKHLQETSPVFHQFLESVRQVQRQFPERFEFNERFLRQLYYHLYSCQFGTFLYNSERERRIPEGGVSPMESTVSVWDFFNSPPETELNKNPDYDPTLDDPSRRGPGADMGVLMFNPKDVRFWNELYGRSDEEMNGKFVTKQVMQDPEFVAPIENADEDPAVITLTSSNAGTETSPSSRSDSPTAAASSSSPTLTRAALQRTASPAPSSPSLSASYSLPTPSARTRAGSIRGQDSASASSSSIPRSPSPRTNRLNSRPPPSPRGASADLFSSTGVRSMWGRFSSNASAAISVVQDAYGGVAKDLSKLSLSGNGSMDAGSEPGGGGELKSRDEINAWASPDRPVSPTIIPTSESTMSSTYVSNPTTSGLGPRSTLNPWASTRGARPTVPSILFDNPWGSNSQSSSSLSTPISAPATTSSASGLPSSSTIQGQTMSLREPQESTRSSPPDASVALRTFIPVSAPRAFSNPEDQDPLTSRLGPSAPLRSSTNWDLGLSDLSPGINVDGNQELSTSLGSVSRLASVGTPRRALSAIATPDPPFGPQAHSPAAASDPLGVGPL